MTAEALLRSGTLGRNRPLHAQAPAVRTFGNCPSTDMEPRANSRHINIAVYSADGITLIAYGTVGITLTNVDSWQGFFSAGAITQLAPLVGGTKYRLVIATDAQDIGYTVYTTHAAPSGGYYTIANYAYSPGTFPSSLPAGTGRGSTWPVQLRGCSSIRRQRLYPFRHGSHSFFHPGVTFEPFEGPFRERSNKLPLLRMTDGDLPCQLQYGIFD